jgi:hypothetical protein
VVRVLLLGIAVLIVVSFLPVQATQPSAFADPAFSTLYDQAGSYGQALLWGSGPLVSMVEPFTGAPGNRRLVQYFDRGRMELARSSSEIADTPTAPPVTQGLLVREMATGNVQVGYDAFVQGDPASLPIFGSAALSADAAALTYADFATAANNRAGNRTQGIGALLDQWIAPGGVVTVATPPVEVRAERYVEMTGHNIPDVTVAWLERDPFGAFTTEEALGYPITEAYWVFSGKGSGGVSLIQLFERRVVVFTPDLPEAERFTLTNSGRHYYRWRYGNDLSLGVVSQNQRSLAPAARGDAGLTLPQGYQATVLARNVPELFGMAVGPDGRIALGHLDGTVTLLDPAHPETRSAPLLEHLANPVALAYAGTDLYVVDDAGLHRFRARVADEQLDAVEDIAAPRFLRETVTLATGPDGTLYYSGQPAADAAVVAQPGGVPRSVLLLEPGATTAAPVTLEISPGGALVVAEDGSLWTANLSGQVLEIVPGSRVNVALDTGLSGDGRVTGIRDLLLYRADGAYGDPYADLLALVGGEQGTHGRVVRLLPARTSPDTPSATATHPGAVVDFISGFERPTHLTAGLDGALYIYDAGRGHIYVVRPL